jgi:hypothetical protein
MCKRSLLSKVFKSKKPNEKKKLGTYIVKKRTKTEQAKGKKG